MRFVSPLALIHILCFSCLPVVAQNVTPVRVGVAVLRGRADPALETEARDQLVDALNHYKLESKLNIFLHAVALTAPPGTKAISEGKEKACEFILYTRVEAVEKASRIALDAHGLSQNVEVDTALVEHELRRVTDGAPYALGITKSQESDSVREAILDAIGNIPNKIAAALRNPGRSKPGASAEISGSMDITPKLNRDEFQGENFCAWLPKNTPHSEALRGVCEYAVSQPQKMPNFICQQETARYQGHRRVPSDLITATIRYVDGEESYRDIQRNGKPVSASMWKSAGLWSSGQFEGNLRNIFDAGNRAVFTFSGENKVGTRSAWVFTYDIGRQYEPLWQLRAGDQLAAPPYEGELWIDAKTGDVLHFRSTAKDMPPTFPVRDAEVVTDYENVAFPDATGFLLPVKSSVATRHRQQEMTRNIVEFHGCHKFRATTRMVDSVPVTSHLERAIEATSAELAAELKASETIFSIVSEDAMVESASQLQLEQQQDLRSATGEAFWRMAQLEKQRQKVLAAAVKNEKPSYEIVSSADGATTFKVNVRLVPVSVVVRDNKGHAVGGLKQEDFSLLDNRKPQEIINFSIAKAAGANGSKTAASASDDHKAAANNVAYVFDDLHTAGPEMARAKTAAIKHLSQLGPQDWAAVFTTSGEVVLDFTADREKLAAALRRLRSHSSASASDCPPLSYYAADAIVTQADENALQSAMEDALDCSSLDARDGPSSPGPVGNFQQAATRERARRMVLTTALEVSSKGKTESDHTLRMLHDVLAWTAEMPGRRSILLVSSGFVVPTREQQRAAAYLIERALRAGVTLNSLDVRGLAGANMLGNSHHVNDPAEKSVLDSQEGSAQSGVMADFAYGTGGTFFHNNNDLEEGFRRTSDAPEYVYVLGFSPQKLDGKLHRLKVTLASQGKLAVQARQGYYALKPTNSQ